MIIIVVVVVAGPSTWNSLPAPLRNYLILITELYNRTYHQHFRVSFYGDIVYSSLSIHIPNLLSRNLAPLRLTVVTVVAVRSSTRNGTTERRRCTI